MDTSARWTRVRDLLGREPTRVEEELAIHLIRTGHLLTVEDVILGRRPFISPIGSLTPVADLILERWDAMDRTHQDSLRTELQGLLWRIRDQKVSDPGPHRTLGTDLDLETILRALDLASRVWFRLDRDQRRRIREALQSFRAAAAKMDTMEKP